MKCQSLFAALAAIAVLGFAVPGAAQVKLRFGHAHPEADSQHVAAVEFARKVKERTQGAVEIQIFPSNQLGNDGAMIAGCAAARSTWRRRGIRAPPGWLESSMPSISRTSSATPRSCIGCSTARSVVRCSTNSRRTS